MAERDPDCIFCKIVAGEIPSTRVFENDHVIAFLDIAPLAPGHTLVIPRAHYARASDLPADLAAEIGKVLPRISSAVMAATRAEGFNLLQSNGGCAGQVVDHVHFHVIPRRRDDGLGFRWKSGSYEEGQAELWQERIQRALD